MVWHLQQLQQQHLVTTTYTLQFGEIKTTSPETGIFTLTFTTTAAATTTTTTITT